MLSRKVSIKKNENTKNDKEKVFKLLKVKNSEHFHRMNSITNLIKQKKRTDIKNRPLEL